MTLSDKIITLAALDMPPAMIIDELEHQYQRDSIEANLRRQGFDIIKPQTAKSPVKRQSFRRPTAVPYEPPVRPPVFKIGRLGGQTPRSPAGSRGSWLWFQQPLTSLEKWSSCYSRAASRCRNASRVLASDFRRSQCAYRGLPATMPGCARAGSRRRSRA